MATFKLIEDEGRIVGYVDEALVVSYTTECTPDYAIDLDAECYPSVTLSYVLDYDRSGVSVYHWFVQKNNTLKSLIPITSEDAIFWTIENQRFLDNETYDHLCDLLEMETGSFERF